MAEHISLPPQQAMETQKPVEQRERPAALRTFEESSQQHQQLSEKMAAQLEQLQADSDISDEVLAFRAADAQLRSLTQSTRTKLYANSDSEYGIISHRLRAGLRLLRETKRYLQEHISPTLRDNPEAVLNPTSEVHRYMEQQDPAYIQEIAAIAAQIDQVPSPDIKSVICIPVAAHQEGKQIYSSLLNYAGQTMPTNSYEILLFINRPDKGLQGEPIVPDETVDEINRFKDDHPEIPIRIMNKVLPAEQAKIGVIRKYLVDTALYRHYYQGKRNTDIIIVSNDADQKGMAPTYLQAMTKTFEDFPKAEAVLGQLDWDPEAYAQYPLVHIGTRLFQFLNVVQRNATKRVVTSGANSAYRAATYAAIGGYNTSLEAGEDVGIGKAIFIARGKDTARVISAQARTTRVYTSARRAISALQNGLTPVQQWDKGFSAFDDEIRKFQLGSTQQINFDDPAQVEQLREGLNWVINRTLDVYSYHHVINKDHPQFQRALRYLGIQYVLNTKGNIQITNIEVLVKRLKRYRDMAVLLRDIKAGKDANGGKKEELMRIEREYQQSISIQDEEFSQIVA